MMRFYIFYILNLIIWLFWQVKAMEFFLFYFLRSDRLQTNFQAFQKSGRWPKKAKLITEMPFFEDYTRAKGELKL